ncbi:outer membrane beta-barrel protein [Massilia sp. H6]|uniref:outer membrane beta-barrel protein n=1 Tax=Massilia sp. H6 TaxID=2970464 RepID=UPI0021673639|nr:outer membrane beta-barrel protein [Massilia sp. H6]UVW27025.1 outer membrane beta-barrel protein [Massilia sp. H6]
MKKIIVAFGYGIALAGAAQAAQASAPVAPTKAYAGVGASASERHGSSVKVGTKIFGGVAFSDSLAVEGGYIDLRKATAAPDARTIDLGGFGTYVAARLMRPLTETLSAFGKLGVAHNQRKLGVSGMPGVRKDTDTGIYGAFGLQYAIKPGVAISAEYERFGKDKKTGAKADAWTLGINFEF